MDEEAKEMVDAMYQRTLQLLEPKKDLIAALSAKLLEKETINHDDIVAVLGDRPFDSGQQYAEFIQGRDAVNAEQAEDAANAEEADEDDLDGVTDAPPVAAA